MLADVLAERGPAAAPHRRDREVRARHVLPQRRRRDAEARARSGSSSPSPKVATYDLQPEMSAPEVTERARRGDRARATPTSTSSTTRTATWSATPACSRRRSRRSRPSTPASGAVVAAIRDAGGVGARHRRPRQRRDDGGRGRRDAVHGAHDSTRCRLIVVADGVTALARRRHARRRRADACSTCSASSSRPSGRDAACWYTDAPRLRPVAGVATAIA